MVYSRCDYYRCSEGYTYRSTTNTCGSCSDTNISLIIVLTPVFIIIFLFGIAYIFAEVALMKERNTDDWINRLLVKLRLVQESSAKEDKQLLKRRLDNFKTRLFTRLKVGLFVLVLRDVGSDCFAFLEIT